MEELPKWAGYAAFALPAASDLPVNLKGLDQAAFDHVTGLMRSYYQSLLAEPVPDELLGLVDAIAAASKRKDESR
jgi:hypothetical protein